MRSGHTACINTHSPYRIHDKAQEPRTTSDVRGVTSDPSPGLLLQRIVDGQSGCLSSCFKSKWYERLPLWILLSIAELQDGSQESAGLGKGGLSLLLDKMPSEWNDAPYFLDDRLAGS